MRAADLKAADIIRCQDFSHHACGTEADARARQSGHKGAFGENIAWSTGPARSPRATLDGWLNSDGHRRNLFQPVWTSQGVGLAQARFKGKRGAAVWVSHFGAPTG